MPQIPAYLEFFNHAMRAILFVVLFGGVALALARTRLSPSTKVKTWLALFVVTSAWFAAILYLSRLGVFQAGTGVTVPLLPFAVLVPIILGLPVLIRSAVIASLVDATPLSWLVGVQFYRVLGGIFLVLWVGGLLPGQFALPAGSGDVLVGLLAVVVAVMAAIGLAAARPAAYAWNMFGILDLVVALATGFLSSPGRFQLLALDQPNLLTTAYPLVLIPAFAVPLSLILHGLCIWKLRREQRSPAAARSADTAAMTV